MKKLAITSTAILALSAVALAPLSAQDWAGRGRAQGIVVNEQGQPIEGATVTLRQSADPDSGPEPLQTNAKGRWSALGLDGGPWRVLIDAEGYLPSEGSISINPFRAGPPVEITLIKNPAASIDAGEKLLDAGDFAGARAEYEKALPDLEAIPAARLRSRIGDTHLQEGNYAAARAEYEKALPYIAPQEQAHIRLQIGNSYQLEGRYADARAEYEKVIPMLGPEGQAPLLLAIARGYDQEEKREQAIQTLERALELQPGNPELLQVIADLLTRVGREADARTYLDQLPEDTQLPSDMVLNIGIRLYNEGDPVKALDYFKRAVEENPEMAEAYYYRGLSYLSQGSNEEATSDFKKLLELEPENPHAEEVKEFLAFLEPED